MGLDIYFYKVRKSDADAISNTREVFDLINDSTECAYFRKANFIYAYFNHIIDSNTECCIVDKDDIESLFESCCLVLENVNNSKIASEVLPTCSGFFFGGTDYNDWYYDKVESCYGQMKVILDEWEDGDAIVIWFSW